MLLRWRILSLTLSLSLGMLTTEPQEKCDCVYNKYRIEYLEKREKDLLNEIAEFYKDNGEDAALDQGVTINRNNQNNEQHLREIEERIRTTSVPTPCN